MQKAPQITLKERRREPEREQYIFPKICNARNKSSTKASNAIAYRQNKASRTTGPANQGFRRMLSHPGCAPQHAGPKD
jgi:hypothetical protein